MLYNQVEIDLKRLSRNYLEKPLDSEESLTEEELQYLFIECNLTYTEIYEFTGKYHNKRIKKLGLEKSKAQFKLANKRYIQIKYEGVHPCRKEEIKERIKQTNLQKYGCENPFGSKEIQERIKQTNLQKYGCENTSSSDVIKNKRKQTNIEKYGCEYGFQSKDVKEKIKQTNLQKYGCENPFGSKEIQERIKQTNLQKYGCESIGHSEEIRKKIEHTNMERYGVLYPVQASWFLEKAKITNLERYGCENPMQNEEIQKKATSTNFLIYGTNNPTQCEKIKNKIKQTNLQKYGCENPMQNENLKRALKEKYFNKYRKFYPTQKHLDPATVEILNDAIFLKQFIDSSEIKTVSYLANKISVSASTFCKYCHQHNLWHLIDHYTSSYELELQEMFPFMQKTKKALYPYEIDLYSEEHKFGIEFNGNYWHCEKKIEDSLYHQKKSLLAEEKGIFLYHIWEYEWLDDRKREIILSQIKNHLGSIERKIFARKCDIREVPFKEARSFLNENHLQGEASSKINLGLYCEDELVSLMTFGKPRFNKNYEWELIRFCGRKGVSIIGGASKLFKCFIQEYEPASILSYSHIDKGTGKLYETLGFKLKCISDPGYAWIGDEVLSRYQCQKHKLLAQGFEGSSEREIMENRGYSRLFDCGNKVWEWLP